MTRTQYKPLLPRFDFDLLYERVRKDMGLCRVDREHGTGHLSFENLAEVIGVTPVQAKRWKIDGSITEPKADAIATRLGYHPVDIWPDYHEVMADYDLALEAYRQDVVERRQASNRRVQAQRKAEAAAKRERLRLAEMIRLTRQQVRVIATVLADMRDRGVSPTDEDLAAFDELVAEFGGLLLAWSEAHLQEVPTA